LRITPATMIMSRSKNAAKSKRAAAEKSNKPKLPQVEECVQNRDYTGAITLLEFDRDTEDLDEEKRQNILMWIGYCAAHLGQYPKAIEAYKEVLMMTDSPPREVHEYMACCLFYSQMYKEAT